MLGRDQLQIAGTNEQKVGGVRRLLARSLAARGGDIGVNSRFRPRLAGQGGSFVSRYLLA